MEVRLPRLLRHRHFADRRSVGEIGLRQRQTLEERGNLIRSKQDEQGRWQLEYNYDGKTWMRFGKMKEPNEWVTLRAMRVLKGIG